VGKGVEEGTVVWTPGRAAFERSNLARFIAWLRNERCLVKDGYHDLWRWSVDDPEAFWGAAWDYFDVQATTRYTRVLSDVSMPGARWFEGASLNFAEHLLRGRGDRVAIVFGNERGDLGLLTFDELRSEVANVQRGLDALGLGRGDRVAAYMPNIRETAVAFLAAAGLGAIWSSCSPEMGTGAVVDRFGQLEPKLLLAVDAYHFGDTLFDRTEELETIRKKLSCVERTVVLPAGGSVDGEWLAWGNAFSNSGDTVPTFVAVPFDHPLWVVYTSGTTGIPKGFVHGHGGILMESLVQSAFHFDLGPGDRFFWFSTTSWVMWNIVVTALAVEAAPVLFDGSPVHPDKAALWRFAERAGVTFFGTSAAFIQANMKSRVRPRKTASLSRIRQVGLTGSPLPPAGFAWIEEEVRLGVFIANVSGGTDVCGGLASATQLLPVRAGELQAPALGVRLEAYDEEGQSVVGEVGELVVTAPMPSMPLFFWNDPNGDRYRESYFDVFPGVWRHGDWVKITEEGSCVIYGRSDATLNRGGIRMGTSEFYRVVEELPAIQDSLIVDLGERGREDRLLLFVVLADGRELDETLAEEIRTVLRRQLSPRHVPDEIIAVLEVPRTLTGKKLEVPVKQILLGRPLSATANPDVMANPESLRPFVEYGGFGGQTSPDAGAG
jgi:acetoacetyl-CoA synthetase